MYKQKQWLQLKGIIEWYYHSQYQSIAIALAEFVLPWGSQLGACDIKQVLHQNFNRRVHVHLLCVVLLLHLLQLPPPKGSAEPSGMRTWQTRGPVAC